MNAATSQRVEFIRAIVLRVFAMMLLAALAAAVAACAHGGPDSRWAEEGVASWYGYDHMLRKTANGERFNPWAMTAAHKTLPFNTVVKVTRLDNGESVTVRINDRGPFIKGRIIDLSRRAAGKIDMIDKGIAPCRVEVVEFPA